TDDRITLDEVSVESERYGMMNAGDVLTPDALFEMVYNLNRNAFCRCPLPLARRATSPEQPVVVTHAPCPLIDLENVRSILIVKLDHLGDVLLTIPAMRRLRELCPEARITALVGSWARPLVEAEPCIDEVLTYDFFSASSGRNCRRLTDADY